MVRDARGVGRQPIMMMGVDVEVVIRRYYHC